MHDQVINPTHPGRAVLLRPPRILQPETVQHTSLRILVERPVQVERHLTLSGSAGSLPWIRISGRPLVPLRDHVVPRVDTG